MWLHKMTRWLENCKETWMRSEHWLSSICLLSPSTNTICYFAKRGQWCELGGVPAGLPVFVARSSEIRCARETRMFSIGQLNTYPLNLPLSGSSLVKFNLCLYTTPRRENVLLCCPSSLPRRQEEVDMEREQGRREGGEWEHQSPSFRS